MIGIRKTVLPLGFVALAALGLAGCPPVTTTAPLGSSVAAATDPGFTGIWRGRAGASEGPSYFTFLPQDDGSINAVVVTPPTPHDKGGWGVFALRTLTLGPNHYLAVHQTIADGKPATGRAAEQTVPVLYRFTPDGALVLYLIDEDRARAAIAANKIAGTAENGKFGDVTLTAIPAALDAYLASPGGRALFGKPLVVLKRLK
jgi:hypothetical protein